VLRRRAHLELILDQAREREVIALGQRLGYVHEAGGTQDSTRLAQGSRQIRRRHVVKRAHEDRHIH
jgi:hypothetical protein